MARLNAAEVRAQLRWRSYTTNKLLSATSLTKWPGLQTIALTQTPLGDYDSLHDPPPFPATSSPPCPWPSGTNSEFSLEFYRPQTALAFSGAHFSFGSLAKWIRVRGFNDYNRQFHLESLVDCEFLVSLSSYQSLERGSGDLVYWSKHRPTWTFGTCWTCCVSHSFGIKESEIDYLVLKQHVVFDVAFSLPPRAPLSSTYIYLFFPDAYNGSKEKKD
ncbi:predicted protein [Histoplasma capsulatum G186AR]|uniref:Uncharacterized protein n=1 Tax=Ajellomyces capsulatus (strain G186AR / H82 / ATCC MYA-2454 / RMSCC 2432) TaxID=447093 RepID=C0NP41_AJECG|nr:uncharacterized protein HCBG_04921 [Histoplasma capsulatum G186AR]EEH06701.1 predicted protein [Histoplasma capsulatum G186AR]